MQEISQSAAIYARVHESDLDAQQTTHENTISNGTASTTRDYKPKTTNEHVMLKKNAFHLTSAKKNGCGQSTRFIVALETAIEARRLQPKNFVAKWCQPIRENRKV